MSNDRIYKESEIWEGELRRTKNVYLLLSKIYLKFLYNDNENVSISITVLNSYEMKKRTKPSAILFKRNW
jgi:hypothetical protein